MLILQGLIFTTLYLALFFKPAFIITAKLIGLDNSEIDYIPLKPKWWEYPIWIFKVFIWAIPSIVGFWFLIKNGFLSQNLIYQLFFK